MKISFFYHLAELSIASGKKAILRRDDGVATPGHHRDPTATVREEQPLGPSDGCVVRDPLLVSVSEKDPKKAAAIHSIAKITVQKIWIVRMW